MTAVDPRADLRFVVPARKVTHYLLALDHPEGGGKAKFFRSRGYTSSKLRSGLLHCGRTGMLHSIERTIWGLRLHVRGTIEPPVGPPAILRTVWQIDSLTPTVARLITAHLD